jgi:glycosyltransferase involved in cell wall biosynthesis
MPLVSVLMPAYNAEKYVACAIESVLQQSYPYFELLILNDGSTDQTQQIIDQFNDARIVKINLVKNQGLVEARNQLVALAKGTYIAFLDADDIALPSRLHLQVSYLEASNVDICGGAHDSLYEESGKLKSSKQRYTDADIRALLTICSPLCNPAVMGKSEVLKKYPYQLGKNYAEDYSLWTQLALAGYHFANLNKKLITYRIHSSQTSQVKNAAVNEIFNDSRNEYLSGLEINPEFCPRVMPFSRRLHLAVPFMWQLNRKILGVSVAANYEIYARFQFRGNGLLTPFTRLERLLISTIAALSGRL